MEKSRAVILREKKVTIIYCKKNSIKEIIDVLRHFNDSKLWNKTKYLWSMEEWKIFFTLKEFLNEQQTTKTPK